MQSQDSIIILDTLAFIRTWRVQTFQMNHLIGENCHATTLGQSISSEINFVIFNYLMS